MLGKASVLTPIDHALFMFNPNADRKSLWRHQNAVAVQHSVNLSAAMTCGENQPVRKKSSSAVCYDPADAGVQGLQIGHGGAEEDFSA